MLALNNFPLINALSTENRKTGRQFPAKAKHFAPEDLKYINIIAVVAADGVCYRSIR